MAALEPTLERFGNPVARYFHATRPPFLLASLVPCLIGIAGASYGGVSINAVAAILTVLGALFAHAGANVLNDYYDALNGTDARNQERVFPFTGGSRFIQNGVLSEVQMQRFGWSLMTAAGLIGLLLVPSAGSGLIAVGFIGILIGWAYSAPPLGLNSRGLGEASVGIGFGSVITLGADMVQRGGFDAFPLLVSVPYALLVAALLYVNQFPDYKADAAAGKHHWVVRLGPMRARWGYLGIVLAAYGYLATLVIAGALPPFAALGLLPLPLSLAAARDVIRNATVPARLVPAIQRTIGAMTAHGLLLSTGLVLAA